MVDAYYFCVGGSVGQFASIARPVGYRCTAATVPDAIERLLQGFKSRREGNENLRQFSSATATTNCARYWRELL